MANTTRTFDVPGISCEHCERRVQQHVNPVPGVETVAVDIDAKTVTVTGGESDAIEAAIVEAGYAVA